MGINQPPPPPGSKPRPNPAPPAPRPPSVRVEIGTIGNFGAAPQVGDKKTVDMSKKDFDSAVADYMSGIPQTAWTSQEWSARQELLIMVAAMASQAQPATQMECRRIVRVARALLEHMNEDEADAVPLLRGDERPPATPVPVGWSKPAPAPRRSWNPFRRKAP